MEDSKYNEYGINKNTDKILFEDIDKYNIAKEEQYNYEYSRILSHLMVYTKFKEKTIFKSLLCRYYGKKYNLNLQCIKYDEKKNEWIYDDGKEIVTFDMISNHIKNKRVKNELHQTRNRKGRCHEMSIEMARDCTELEDSYVVTGTISQYNIQILHSVVETNKGGKTIILDYTMNLKMSKGEYQKLTNFQEISRVKGKEIDEDFEKLWKIFDEIPQRRYLTFRDELMSDIEKNKKLFDDDGR